MTISPSRDYAAEAAADRHAAKEDALSSALSRLREAIKDVGQTRFTSIALTELDKAEQMARAALRGEG